MVTSEPIEFEITLLENISLLCTSTKNVQQVVTTGSNALTLATQQVHNTTSAFDVVDKVRAYLFSLSYVSCATPEWCKFSVVRTAVEDIGVKI